MRWIVGACLAVLLVGCDAAESPSAVPERASTSSTDGPDRGRGDDAADRVRNGPIVSDEAVRPPTSWCPGCDFARPWDRSGDVALYLREAGTMRSGASWIDGIAVVGPRNRVTTLSCPADFPCREGGSPVRGEYLAQVDWQYPGSGPVALGPGDDELSMVSFRARVDVVSFGGEVRRSVRLRGLDDDERVIDLAWSPDRRRLAVTTGHARAWVFDADGSGGHVVYRSQATTGPRYVTDVAWSPTGDAIGAIESYEFNGSVYLVLFGPRAAKARQVFWWPSGDFGETYLWSPDGRRVAVDDGRRLLELSVDDGRVLARHPRVTDPVWLARPS